VQAQQRVQALRQASASRVALGPEVPKNPSSQIAPLGPPQGLAQGLGRVVLRQKRALGPTELARRLAPGSAPSTLRPQSLSRCLLAACSLLAAKAWPKTTASSQDKGARSSAPRGSPQAPPTKYPLASFFRAIRLSRSTGPDRITRPVGPSPPPLSGRHCLIYQHPHPLSRSGSTLDRLLRITPLGPGRHPSPSVGDPAPRAPPAGRATCHRHHFDIEAHLAPCRRASRRRSVGAAPNDRLREQAT
jgi:hypothetical protein